MEPKTVEIKKLNYTYGELRNKFFRDGVKEVNLTSLFTLINGGGQGNDIDFRYEDQLVAWLKWNGNLRYHSDDSESIEKANEIIDYLNDLLAEVATEPSESKEASSCELQLSTASEKILELQSTINLLNAEIDQLSLKSALLQGKVEVYERLFSPENV